ncbi:hypothetical protein ACSBL2_18715 [Pedobacter sp. AW31-3R]|uniref:hypothetical protein n=1 Tax=Pedobacter sp. AW31-3R TaxID=3445781 RepID=UPI003F9F7E42
MKITREIYTKSIIGYLCIAMCFTACKTKKEERIPEKTTVVTYQLSGLQDSNSYVDSVPAIFALEDTSLMESSGLAFSVNHPGLLYTHEDSKCTNKISIINTLGKNTGSIWLEGLENRDWEDISVARSAVDSTSYIYVANIGDNGRKYEEVQIFRFPEPMFPGKDIKVVPQQMKIVYPNGPVNAETILVDHNSSDIWIVSKETSGATLYKLNWSTSDVVVAQPMLRMPFEKITGGDISRDGARIILRSRSAIYLWEKKAEVSVAEAMAAAPSKIPHLKENQSEGICFKPDGTGFFTSTEIKRKSAEKPYISEYSSKSSR